MKVAGTKQWKQRMAGSVSVQSHDPSCYLSFYHSEYLMGSQAVTVGTAGLWSCQDTVLPTKWTLKMAKEHSRPRQLVWFYFCWFLFYLSEVFPWYTCNIYSWNWPRCTGGHSEGQADIAAVENVVLSACFTQLFDLTGCALSVMCITETYGKT